MFKTDCTITLLVSLVIVIEPRLVQTQRATIPEMISRGGATSTSTVPSGLPPSVDELLRITDVVVTGTIGQPRSYLSSDQTEIYTDYDIIAPVIFFQSQVITRPTPGPPPGVTVTLRGGTLMVSGISFTQTEPALPPLQSGTQGLFLLRRVDGKYQIAGMFFGAFSIIEGRIMPLVARDDFAPEYRNVTLSEAMKSMLAILQARVAFSAYFIAFPLHNGPVENAQTR
jgi:hypothetical protein